MLSTVAFHRWTRDCIGIHLGLHTVQSLLTELEQNCPPPPPHPPALGASVITEIGARRVLSLQRTTSYTFFSTNEQRRIRHHITCSSSNLVYMIQCNKCNVQYIGNTKRHTIDRFGENRRAMEKAITQQHIDQPTAVSDHFIFLAHSMGNIELVILELITSNRHAIRKAREAFMPQGTLLPSIARKAVPRVAP